VEKCGLIHIQKLILFILTFQLGINRKMAIDENKNERVVILTAINNLIYITTPL
jgi:hypothetical protein